MVDDAGDVVTEKTDEGTDEVKTSLTTYSFAALDNIENLTYTGTSAFHGTGNGLANFIRGGNGDDRLDGGSGSDTLIGGKGDDTYVVDAVGDVVTELDGEGIDTIETDLVTEIHEEYSVWDSTTVISLVDFPNVENLTFTGTNPLALFHGDGNDLDNVIIGGPGSDALDGGLGADTLIGGAGGDTYHVDGDDTVVEVDDGSWNGIATKLSYFNLADFPYLNTLSFSGTSNSVGYGTDGENWIWGGEGNDKLFGGAGNDVIYGSHGGDSLVGGDGDDTLHESFVANARYTHDVLDTFMGGAGNDSMYGSAYDDIFWGDDTDSDAGNDTVRANGGNDTVYGLAGNDVLDGYWGRDLLQGGRGSDLLEGGDGNDRIESANGMGGDEGDVDTMNGGGGTDTFVYQARGILIIEDFKDYETLTLSFQDPLDPSAVHVAYDDTTKDSTITFDGYDAALNHVVMYDFDATSLDVSVYGSDLMLA